MNAPANATAVAALPIDEIVPSPSNPRKHFDDNYLLDLAESIKAHGVIQPITVRPLPLDALFAFNKRRKAGDDRAPKYEIVVGECRFRAALQAGLVEIPAFWRELDDKQVLEIQVVENLQRRDVHPLEEAEGYQQLMQRHGYTADSLAARIGKSKGYVYGRLKLLALGPRVRDAFFAGTLEASTALLIARIPASLQPKALDKVINGYGGEPLSYRSAKNTLQQQFTVDLGEATFGREDATLCPAAGSCSACPKRAGNDLVLTAEGLAADVCTDTACFDEKILARRAQLIAHAEKKGIKVYVGEAAREFMPHGTYHLDEAQYVSLDARVPGDGQERTYREILGEAAPVVALVENSLDETALITLGNPTALERALKKAGWKPAEDREEEIVTAKQRDQARQEREQRDAEWEEKEKAREAEGERRRQLKEDALDRISCLALEGKTNPTHLQQLTRLFLRSMFLKETEITGLETEYLKRYGYVLPDPYDEEEELQKILDAMKAWPLGKLFAFMFEYLVYDDVSVEYDWNPAAPKHPTLTALAEYFDLDPNPAAQAPAKEAAKPKGKAKAKTDPAPASPAYEPAAPVKTFATLPAWPFPTSNRPEAA